MESSSISSNGTIEVNVAPLDELLQSVSPSYIKMDIEGAEPEALEGAVGIIRKNLPILAIWRLSPIRPSLAIAPADTIIVSALPLLSSASRS